MSKYTTEVRFICEQKAGLSESEGYLSIEQIIARARDKVFNFSYPIFDENYRSVLECKILRHFYTREICAETVGLWQLWLNDKLNMIMPYYNQLYKSELIQFNPMYDVDLTTTGRKDGTDNEHTTSKNESDYLRTDNLTGTRTDNLNHSNTHNDTDRDLYSDTPQGALTGIENETWLTNARKQTNTGGSTDTNTGTQKMENTGTQRTEGEEDFNGTRNMTSIDEYTEHVTGKRGGKNYSEMLLDFRKTFLNIDAMIIEELNDLFFNLW